MDECSISAAGSHGNVWVTRKPGEEFLENCIAPKFSDYSAAMIWVLFGVERSQRLWFGTRSAGVRLGQRHTATTFSILLSSNVRHGPSRPVLSVDEDWTA